MPNDIPDWTDQVNVSGGTVNIGSANVTVVGGQNGVNISIDSPPLLLGTVSIGAGQTSGVAAFSLPANATGILVVVPTQIGGVQGSCFVRVIGGASNQDYINQGLVNMGDALVATIPGAAENPIAVWVYTATATTGSGTAAIVYALIGAGVTAVYAPPEQPLPVTVSIAGGAGLASSYVNISGANGATQTVVAGQAHQQITVWGWNLSVSPFTGGPNPAVLKGILESSANAVDIGIVRFMWGSQAGTCGHSLAVNIPQGLLLPVGSGVIGRVVSTQGGIDLEGHVRYSTLFVP